MSSPEVYSAGLDLSAAGGRKKPVKLASNENPWGTSYAVRSALLRSLSSLWRYPDNSYIQLKELIAKKTGVRPETVVVGNGSDEILQQVIAYMMPPGTNALIPSPSFQMYRIFLKNFRKPFREIPLRGWQYDLSALRKQVGPKTGLVILCNPNNPTGTWISREDLIRFLHSVPRRVMVLIDEAYAEYADDPAYPESVSLIRSFPNLIVLRTCSKYFGLAGIRLGYGFLSLRSAALYEKFRVPFTVNNLAVEAGKAVFKPGFRFSDIRTRVKREKNFLEQGFRQLGIAFVESQTNFIFCYKLPGSVRIFRALLGQGVIVRELSSFGLKNCLRITVGRRKENKRVLSALKKIMLSRRSG